MKKICIVVGCYNEEKNLVKLYDQLKDVTNNLSNYRWELLFADNCSNDKSEGILRELAMKDKRVKVILNMANYGVARSYSNALCAVDADATIIMASDLEDPPELIRNFVEEWDKGYKVVFAKYKRRQEGVFIRICRKIYYWITIGLAEYKIESNLTGFGLLDRSVIDTIKSFHDPYIHVGNLIAEMKYEVKYILFDKPKRQSGKSSYSFRKYYRTAMDNIVMSSQTLLHTASFLGAALSVLCLIVAFYFFLGKLINWNSFELGLAPILIGIFFLGGVQLFFIGIVGEYLGNVIKRVTTRPYVLEKERINFEKCDESND